MYDLKGKRVLILGGLGFIGSHITRALLALGAQVTIVERTVKPIDAAIEGRITLLNKDAYDTASYRDSIRGSDIILNLVGFRTDSPSFAQESWRINCGVAINVLEAARETKPLVVHFGSRLQYGAPERLPVDESQPCRPEDIYSIHKTAAESYHQFYAKEFGVPVICLRLSIVYGGGRTILQQVFTTLSGGGTFVIRGDGSQEKDFIHITDLVRAVFACLSEERCVGETINIGSGCSAVFKDVIALLQRTLGAGTVAFDLAAPSHDYSFVADIGKIRALTGWKPEVGLEEGIRLLIADPSTDANTRRYT